MFFKQSGFKPRSGSSSSQASSGSQLAGSPPKNEIKATATKLTEPATPLSAAAAGRRRSSADQFGGLQSLKRNSQDDKRAGFLEQKPGQQGVLGGMWNSFTKGTS